MVSNLCEEGGRSPQVVEDPTPKQKLFVDHYLQSFNATDAARRAGYKGNDKTLAVVGSENLRKPCIISQLTKRWNQAAAKSDKRIINTYEEFTKNLDFVSKLRDACERWLQEPESVEFSINPRGDEIDIIYFDFEDKDNQGNPKRKQACLQDVLARLQGTRYESEAQFIKTVDIREFALKTIDRIDTTLDKFAKLSGAYVKDAPNPADLTKVLEAYRLWADKNPGASLEERREAVRIFASGRDIDVSVLAEKAGITELSMVQ